MSITMKLHFLLIMTIVGVGLYMYLLYKEIRSFEKDIHELRMRVQALSVQDVAPIQQPQNIDETKPSDQQCGETRCVESTDGAYITTNDDDNLSVTSNEIKDILTNIEDEDADASVDGKQKNNAEQEVETEFTSLTEGELSTHKYDDLRNFLRKKGINMRGSKQDIINKILSLQQ